MNNPREDDTANMTKIFQNIEIPGDKGHLGICLLTVKWANVKNEEVLEFLRKKIEKLLKSDQKRVMFE